MSFRIRGLDPKHFFPLFGLGDAQLAAQRARRHVADVKPGFPDRIELRDAEPGERVLLVNYMHQPADNPYRASHAIFILEGAMRAFDAVGEVPAALRSRALSLRAFDGADVMVRAELGEGRRFEAMIESLFGDPQVAYVQAHYALRGCYAARVERVR